MTQSTYIRKFLLGATMLVLALLSVALLQPGRAHAYSNNELMSDSVYLDAGSMSPAQIQSFLASKGSYLAGYTSFSARDNANVSAAQIIYEAAQDYGINPQVIMSTLQKEQSLISDPSPSSSQINFAMGYGCPDGGSCSYPGFFNQVDNATWQFRFNYERASGNNSWWRPSISYACAGATRYYSTGLFPGRNVTFKDDNGTSYATFVIANATTASFYCYTPHAYNNPQGLYGNPQFGTTGQYYSGSYNFVTSFERWFGGTLGDLVRTVDNSTVYLVSGDNKYPIGDGSVFADYGALGPVRFVASGSLANKATGAPLSHMAGSASGTLYFVASSIKLPFTSCGQVAAFGYSCGLVNYLTEGQLAKLASAPPITQYYNTTSGKRFYIDGGAKREIFDDQSLSQAGLGGAAHVLNEQSIAYLPYGQPVIRNGAVAMSRGGDGHYLFDTGKFHPLDGEIGNFAYIRGLPHSSFDQQSFAAQGVISPLSGMIANAGQSSKYVMTPSGKVAISSPTNWGTAFTSLSDALLSALPNGTEPINNQLIKSQSSPTVYYVTNGKKRPIPSWADLVNLKISPITINTLPSKTVSAIAEGPKMYSPGRMVKTAGSPTVYVVRSATELYTISTFTYPYELGLEMDVLTMTDADFQTYTVAGPIQTKVSCGGSLYIGNNRAAYQLSAPKATQFGFNTGEFVDASASCLNAPVATQALGDFIRVGNGTIYQVQNGVKQAFTSFGAYQAHGGTSQNTTFASDYFASLIPSGPNITQ